MENLDDTSFEVFCNYCEARVPVLEVTHKVDFPSVGDLTHWHKGHNIIDDSPYSHVSPYDGLCLAEKGMHICQKPEEFHEIHSCGIADCEEEWS